MMIILFIALLLNKIKHDKSSPITNIEIRWILGIILLVFLSVSFNGGEFVFLRYVYFIMPLLYISSVSLFDRMSGKYSHLQRAVVLICVLFAFSNAAYGALKDRSAFIFLDSAAINSKLEEHNNEKIIVIVDQIGPAVPTGNLTKYKLFDEIHMDTMDNIVKNNIFGECLQNERKFVVYIATDTYWLNGLDPEDVFNEFARQRQNDFAYTKIADGTLGEFYLRGC